MLRNFRNTFKNSKFLRYLRYTVTVDSNKKILKSHVSSISKYRFIFVQYSIFLKQKKRYSFKIIIKISI